MGGLSFLPLAGVIGKWLSESIVREFFTTGKDP
jgi:hypothetical protein